MQLDTVSLKPQICAISKRDLAETASPNDCVYCILYQTACFCPGKRLSKQALMSYWVLQRPILGPYSSSFFFGPLGFKPVLKNGH